jgi:glyoxylase-like metal-dependent hydrolase (beta-lactamase superfamily II)
VLLNCGSVSPCTEVLEPALAKGRRLLLLDEMRTLRLFCAIVAALPGFARAQSAPAYEVYAVRFATQPSYATRYLVAGADSARRSQLAFTVWLIRGNGRTMLMDAGFYRPKFVDSWKPAGYTKPSDALAALGVKPENVTDIVISHVHWDHLDGVDLFPKARVWIQRDEYEHYTNDSGAVLDRAIDPDDAKMLAGLKRAGRVNLIPGDSTEIIPGITVFTGGKHTYASEFATVHASLAGGRTGTIVLASDNAYLYENLERHRPIAQSLDTLSNLHAQERMAHLASEQRLIVPGHDSDVFVRFPRPGNGIARIE